MVLTARMDTALLSVANTSVYTRGGPRLYFLPMNKSSTCRFAVALALAGALWVADVYGQFGDQAAKLNLVKVKDDLFVIHNDFVPGNSTALITSEGVILVDDKFEIDHAGILAEL